MTGRTKPAYPLDAYAGSYKSPIYGSINVTVSGERLVLQFGSRFHGRLTPSEKESFRAEFVEPLHEDWLITFQNSENKVTSMIAKEAPWAPEWYEDREDLGVFHRV